MVFITMTFMRGICPSFSCIDFTAYNFICRCIIITYMIQTDNNYLKLKLLAIFVFCVLFSVTFSLDTGLSHFGFPFAHLTLEYANFEYEFNVVALLLNLLIGFPLLFFGLSKVYDKLDFKFLLISTLCLLPLVLLVYPFSIALSYFYLLLRVLIELVVLRFNNGSREFSDFILSYQTLVQIPITIIGGFLHLLTVKVLTRLYKFYKILRVRNTGTN